MPKLPWGVTNCGYGCRHMSSYVVVPAVGAQRGSVSDVPKFLEEKEAFDAAYDELLLQAECIDGKLEKTCSSGFKWHRMAQYGTFANRKRV